MKKHKNKIKKARGLISKQEIEKRVSLFQTKGWSLRADAKRKKVEKQRKNKK